MNPAFLNAVRIFLMPFDGQTVQLPTALNIIAHVLSTVFIALFVATVLTYVALVLGSAMKAARALMKRSDKTPTPHTDD